MFTYNRDTCVSMYQIFYSLYFSSYCPMLSSFLSLGLNSVIRITTPVIQMFKIDTVPVLE